MPVPVKRGNRWRIRVQRKGLPALSFTAATKGECEAWLHQQMAERQPDGAVLEVPLPPGAWTIRRMVEHYRDTVTVTHKAAEAEGYHLDAMLQADFADAFVHEVGRRDYILWFKDRLKEVAAATAVRELNL